MNISELYALTRKRVMLGSHIGLRNSFQQIVGEHAMHFVDFLAADREKDKRRQLTTWVKINDVNRNWLQLVCPILHETNEAFYNVTSKLIQNYSHVIGDFIIDADSLQTEKIEEMAKLGGDFYAALVDPNKREATRKQWVEYTKSIGSMIYNYDMHGPTSHNFLHAANDCICAGQLLGAWLDTSL